PSSAIASWTATAITTSIPASTFPGTQTVVVSADGIDSSPFSFVTHAAPNISSPITSGQAGVCLAQGMPTTCVLRGAPGALVYIIGDAFGQVQGDSTVSFGSVQVPQSQTTFIGGSFLSAIIPTGIAPGTMPVSVTVDGVSSPGVGFTVLAAPVI